MIAPIDSMKMVHNFGLFIWRPPMRGISVRLPMKSMQFRLTSGRDLINAYPHWQDEGRFSDENPFRWLDRHRFCNLDCFMPDADFSRGSVRCFEGYSAPPQR